MTWPTAAMVAESIVNEVLAERCIESRDSAAVVVWKDAVRARLGTPGRRVSVCEDPPSSPRPRDVWVPTRGRPPALYEWSSGQWRRRPLRLPRAR